MPTCVRTTVPLIAAIALALVVLAPRPAEAVRLVVSLSQTPGPGGYDYTYTVTDGNTAPGNTISQITIPELHAGDLLAATLPTGWGAVETTTGLNSNVHIVGHTVGANITLSTSISADNIPANNGSADFTFTSVYVGNLSSTWIDFDQAGSGSAAGVAIPDSSQPVQPVPEPSSLAIAGVGLLGVGAAVRRRRRGAARAAH